MKKLFCLLLVGFALFFATSCSANTTSKEVVKKEAVSTAKVQTEATGVVFTARQYYIDDFAYVYKQTSKNVEIYAMATTKPYVPKEIGSDLIDKWRNLSKKNYINYRT